MDSIVGMALLGGVLVGGAIGTLSLLTGRVMSGSAMMGSLLGGAEGVAATSIAFIGGFVSVAFFLNDHSFVPTEVTEPGQAFLIIGGILVGVSARLGGASLGAVLTGIARRTPGALFMLLVLLSGATLGGLLKVFLDAGGLI